MIWHITTTLKKKKKKRDISNELEDGELIQYAQTKSFEFTPELSCETCKVSYIILI